VKFCWVLLKEDFEGEIARAKALKALVVRAHSTTDNLSS